MGVYRTAIVQGLGIAHGRGERRQFSPVKSEVNYLNPTKGYMVSVDISLTPSRLCLGPLSHSLEA